MPAGELLVGEPDSPLRTNDSQRAVVFLGCKAVEGKAQNVSHATEYRQEPISVPGKTNHLAREWCPVPIHF